MCISIFHYISLYVVIFHYIYIFHYISKNLHTHHRSLNVWYTISMAETCSQFCQLWRCQLSLLGVASSHRASARLSSSSVRCSCATESNGSLLREPMVTNGHGMSWSPETACFVCDTHYGIFWFWNSHQWSSMVTDSTQNPKWLCSVKIRIHMIHIDTPLTWTPLYK